MINNMCCKEEKVQLGCGWDEDAHFLLWLHGYYYKHETKILEKQQLSILYMGMKTPKDYQYIVYN